MTKREKCFIGFGSALIAVAAFAIYALPGIISHGKAQRELNMAISEIDHLLEQSIKPTPLRPVRITVNGTTFGQIEYSGGGINHSLTATRDITNEIEFIRALGMSSFKAVESAKILFPNKADDLRSSLDSLETAIGDSFPEIIDNDTDLAYCDQKAITALRKFLDEILTITNHRS
jgi:hypothetical protein